LLVACWFLSPWWWMRYIPPKCEFLQEPHGVTSQKTAFFILLQCTGLILPPIFAVYASLLLLLITNWRYMFQPNWPASCTRCVVRPTAVLHFYSNCRGELFIGAVPRSCSWSMYLWRVTVYTEQYVRLAFIYAWFLQTWCYIEFCSSADFPLARCLAVIKPKKCNKQTHK
jgi:hypothetical protein